MSELEEAIKLFGRKDLLGGYGIQDTDTNIEVFMSIKDMVKYYRQDLEIERVNNIIVKLKKVLWQRCKETRKNEQYVRLNCYKDILNELTYLLMQGSDKE